MTRWCETWCLARWEEHHLGFFRAASEGFDSMQSSLLKDQAHRFDLGRAAMVTLGRKARGTSTKVIKSREKSFPRPFVGSVHESSASAMGCAASAASRRGLDSVVSNRSSAASSRSKASKSSNLSERLRESRLVAVKGSSAFQAGARAKGDKEAAAAPVAEAKVSLKESLKIGVIVEDEEEIEDVVMCPSRLNDHSLGDFSHPFCPVHKGT